MFRVGTREKKNRRSGSRRKFRGEGTPGHSGAVRNHKHVVRGEAACPPDILMLTVDEGHGMQNNLC